MTAVIEVDVDALAIAGLASAALLSFTGPVCLGFASIFVFKALDCCGLGIVTFGVGSGDASGVCVVSFAAEVGCLISADSGCLIWTDAGCLIWVDDSNLSALGEAHVCGAARCCRTPAPLTVLARLA